ncbi:sigma-54-dependent Fis family transcriptional regulator [Treponema vincentii]|uniref:Sigma-54-dependent Fis family transcriptional regulator n=1 Tax=Treponema vincentii TaxID=69710 RepID=A0A6P1XZ19_9SPIR|nr:sigma 54-interacting transcriptional regulator [Treponema vincentii]QHX42605.1 sigma-54-dependent Fis family transcriptional regulator [Treponema vincentii]
MYISGRILPERLAALINTPLFTRGALASGDTLLELILRSTMQAVGSTAASLFLADETLQNARTIAYICDDTFYCIDAKRALPAAAAWVLRQNEPLRMNTPDTESRFTSNGMDETPYSASGFIAVPLRIEDFRIGILEAVDKKDGGNFSEADLSLLSLIAGYAAPVYRTSCAYRLYVDTVKYTEQRTDREAKETPFIAASPVMREKLALCKQLAFSDIPVFIIGENGVGKTSVAKQLHIYSRRADYPFIRVNCAEPAEELLAHRLFGAKSDSTDVSDESCFKQAEGGTLFLDEAAAIPLSLQKRLLDRILQLEQSSGNIRLIASTSRDIEQLTREGDFLSELYGKLNVLPLYIPPLRQRKEDIDALARFFLHQAAQEMRKPFIDFSPDAHEALQQAEWKGNIRELKNTVEYGCLNGCPPLVTAEYLFPRSTVAVSAGDVGGLKSATDAFKRTYIRTVLETTGGNQTAAASILKIQRTYLSRLMKELNIKN